MRRMFLAAGGAALSAFVLTLGCGAAGAPMDGSASGGSVSSSNNIRSLSLGEKYFEEPSPDDGGVLKSSGMGEFAGKMGRGSGGGGPAAAAPPILDEDDPTWRAVSRTEDAELWQRAEADAARLPPDEHDALAEWTLLSVRRHRAQPEVAQAIFERRSGNLAAQMPIDLAPPAVFVDYGHVEGAWQPLRVVDAQDRPLAAAMQMLKR